MSLLVVAAPILSARCGLKQQLARGALLLQVCVGLGFGFRPAIAATLAHTLALSIAACGCAVSRVPLLLSEVNVLGKNSRHFRPQTARGPAQRQQVFFFATAIGIASVVLRFYWRVFLGPAHLERLGRAALTQQLTFFALLWVWRGFASLNCFLIICASCSERICSSQKCCRFRLSLRSFFVFFVLIGVQQLVAFIGESVQTRVERLDSLRFILLEPLRFVALPAGLYLLLWGQLFDFHLRIGGCCLISRKIN